MWFGRKFLTLTGVVAGGVLTCAALAAMGSAGDAAAQAARTKTASGSTQTFVPAPHRVYSRRGPLAQTRTSLVPLHSAPFPYDGLVPATNRPFIETADDGRRYHRSRGSLLWEDENFSDSHVLLHIPKGFDARRPGLIVVYFHGHGAQLETDVYARQQIAEQVTRSGLNAVLIAPQFAVNATDSSAGKLWQPNGLARLIEEAARHFADLYGDPRAKSTFERLPVVAVAYSGGYAPAAWTIRHGGLGDRVKGLLLFDALYGEVDTFANWVSAVPNRFLISTFTSSTRGGNMRLQKLVAERGVQISTGLHGPLRSGGVALLEGRRDSNHRDLLTSAWVDLPLQHILARISGYQRS